MKEASEVGMTNNKSDSKVKMSMNRYKESEVGKMKVKNMIKIRSALVVGGKEHLE